MSPDPESGWAMRSRFPRTRSDGPKTTDGACIKAPTGNQLSITISNKVQFAGRVKGLRLRIQWALNNQAKAMGWQIEDTTLKGAA
jgi:hypothetical protein